MALDSASEVGRIIGGLVNTTNQIQSDHVPGAIDQGIVLTPIDKSKVQTTVVITKYFYPTDSFIIDHIVYGEIDSSVLKLDGGYAESEGTTFPLTFPVIFSGGTSTVIHGTYTG